MQKMRQTDTWINDGQVIPKCHSAYTFAYTGANTSDTKRTAWTGRKALETTSDCHA